MIWNQTAAGFGQANWEAGSQVNSEQARLSNFDWAKIVPLWNVWGIYFGSDCTLQVERRSWYKVSHSDTFSL